MESSVLIAIDEVEVASMADAVLPAFLYFETGRFAGSIQISGDPQAPLLPQKSPHNSIEDVQDVCEMLDEALAERLHYESAFIH